MLLAECVMLKNVSFQSFACICVHSSYRQPAWLWADQSEIKTVLHENLTSFSFLYQIESFLPPQSLSVSYLKAFSSDLCWHVLCETMILVWPFMQPSFPRQWQETISSYKHYCSPSFTIMLILPSQLLWKMLVVFFFFFSCTLHILIESSYIFLFFISYVHSINPSVKESTFYCILLSVCYLLTRISISLYIYIIYICTNMYIYL